jgi:hypothetical protein
MTDQPLPTPGAARQKGTLNLPCGDHHWTRQDPERAARVIQAAIAAPKNPVRGEQSPSSRVTESDVLAMRSTYRLGGTSLKALAWQYGIAIMTVQNIIARKTWRHV